MMYSRQPLRAELREALQPAVIQRAVQEGINIIADFRSMTSIGEIADCSLDQMYETTVYLTPAEIADVEVEVEREVYRRFGFSSDVANHADITWEALSKEVTS